LLFEKSRMSKMQAIPRILKSATLAMAMAASLAAQQGATGQAASGHAATSHDAHQQQSQGNAAGSRTVDQQAADAANASNPGFGAQDPNRELSGGQPHTNSTLQNDRNGDQGLEIGWLGLLGLAGLFGIGRGRKEENRHEIPVSTAKNRS
jgi:MYXO-CTERM domain-containing protein